MSRPGALSSQPSCPPRPPCPTPAFQHAGLSPPQTKPETPSGTPSQRLRLETQATPSYPLALQCLAGCSWAVPPLCGQPPYPSRGPDPSAQETLPRSKAALILLCSSCGPSSQPIDLNLDGSHSPSPGLLTHERTLRASLSLKGWGEGPGPLNRKPGSCAHGLPCSVKQFPSPLNLSFPTFDTGKGWLLPTKVRLCSSSAQEVPVHG